MPPILYNVQNLPQQVHLCRYGAIFSKEITQPVGEVMVRTQEIQLFELAPGVVEKSIAVLSTENATLEYAGVQTLRPKQLELLHHGISITWSMSSLVKIRFDTKRIQRLFI